MSSLKCVTVMSAAWLSGLSVMTESRWLFLFRYFICWPQFTEVTRADTEKTKSSSSTKSRVPYSRKLSEPVPWKVVLSTTFWVR